MNTMEKATIFEALLGVTVLAVIMITGAIVAFRPTRSQAKPQTQARRVAAH